MNLHKKFQSLVDDEVNVMYLKSDSGSPAVILKEIFYRIHYSQARMQTIMMKIMKIVKKKIARKISTKVRLTLLPQLHRLPAPVPQQ